MRRVIFNLALLLLVVVVLASLGTPGATAATPPVSSPSLDRVAAEQVVEQPVVRHFAPNMLKGGTLFDAWLYASATTAPRKGSDTQGLSPGSTS